MDNDSLLRDDVHSGDPNLGFTQTLFLVKRLQFVIRALMDDALRPFQITPLQYTILTILQHKGTMSSVALARRVFLKPQTMHEIVNLFEKRCLIQKERNPDDRRASLISLSPAGIELLRQCYPIVLNLEDRLLSNFTSGQRLIFREGLLGGIAALTAEAKARNVVADAAT